MHKRVDRPVSHQILKGWAANQAVHLGAFRSCVEQAENWKLFKASPRSHRVFSALPLFYRALALKVSGLLATASDVYAGMLVYYIYR